MDELEQAQEQSAFAGDAPATLQNATIETTGEADAPSAQSDSMLSFFDPSGVVPAVFTIIIALILARLLPKATESLSERFGSRRLWIKQAGTFVSFAIYGLMVLICVVLLFDFSSQALFALSGGAAVTIGFALKDVASSFLASITILVTKPFQVGDRVAVGAYYGEVIEIGLRSVRLVTLDDNLVTIPSNAFLNDAVANANAGALDCMVVMPFYIASNADIRRAKAIVQDAVLASRFLYLGKPFIVLVSTEMSAQGSVFIELRAKAYVYDARHEKSFLSDVTQQVIERFQDERIRMPSPPVD